MMITEQFTSLFTVLSMYLYSGYSPDIQSSACMC